MTDRLLLSFSAALNALNASIIGIDQAGVYDVPGVAMAAVAVVSLTFAAFVGAFMGNMGSVDGDS